MSTVLVIVAHALVASSKPKVELDLQADMCVAGYNCLVSHDHNRPVNVYSDQKDGHKSAQIVDATVGYQDPQSVQMFILMINQSIHFNGLENYLLYWMQCHPNGVHISKVPKFLTERHSVTTHVH